MFPLIPLAICVSLNFFLGLIILNSFNRKVYTCIWNRQRGHISRKMDEREGRIEFSEGWSVEIEMAWLSIFPRTEKFYPPSSRSGLDTEPGMNFPVDFSVEFVSSVIPFWGWDSTLKNRMKNCYKNNNNNILNGMNVWQMDIKNCTTDEIKDKGKEIMKFYFNKVRVFTLWIKLCSPI